MHEIETITELLAAIDSQGKVTAEHWPELFALTPQDLGLQRSGTDLFWPESIDKLDESRMQKVFPELVAKVFPLIDSTNSRMVQQGSVNSIADQLYLAEFQYGGRGRRGRSWLSPYGRNIAMSLGAATGREMPELGGLSIVVGLALAQALENMGVRNLRMKWPNDILVEDHKLCGILLELVQRNADVEFVAGIGINVALTDEEISQIGQPVTDLRRCGVAASRTELVIKLVLQIREFLQHFEQAGFMPFVGAFNDLHKFHGETCSIIQGTQVTTGTVSGVGTQGELILQTKIGEQRFHGGEVSLRPPI